MHLWFYLLIPLLGSQPSLLLLAALNLGLGLVVLLLAPECYLPLRRVGAGFHAAQNGLDAAADTGALLDRPVPPSGTAAVPERAAIEVRQVSVAERHVDFDGTLAPIVPDPDDAAPETPPQDARE